MKNANVPSNDLLNSFVFPYFNPIIAAIESDKLVTNMAIIAIFSLNNIMVTEKPIKR